VTKSARVAVYIVWAAIPVADALADLRRCSGSQLHPRVVREFCKLIEQSAHDRRRASARRAAP